MSGRDSEPTVFTSNEQVDSRPRPADNKSRIEHLRELARWAGVEWFAHSMHDTAEVAIIRAADLKEQVRKLESHIVDVYNAQEAKHSETTARRLADTPTNRMQAKFDAARDAQDAERFVWWFSTTHDKGDYINEYLRGVRENWTLSQWRESIDAFRRAVKSSREPALTISKPPQNITASASIGDVPPTRSPASPVECPKCRTQLAFAGDLCWFCQEEANAPINS